MAAIDTMIPIPYRIGELREELSDTFTLDLEPLDGAGPLPFAPGQFNMLYAFGLGEVAISDHRSSQPTFDELARLASEVHVAGLISRKAGVMHLHLGDGERGLSLVRRRRQPF